MYAIMIPVTHTAIIHRPEVVLPVHVGHDDENVDEPS